MWRSTARWSSTAPARRAEPISGRAPSKGPPAGVPKGLWRPGDEAPQLLSAGVPVEAVSERLGHSSTSFPMDAYSAVIPSMGRGAADAADQLFGGERGR